jgi:hypothetical protein
VVLHSFEVGSVLAGSDFLRHDEIYLDAVTDAINRYRPASK